MSLVVQKYGGTSVGDASRIRSVAGRVAARRRSGDSIVVIVSAMGHTTDELIRLSSEVSPHHHPREMDMLLTAGERISMALLAMAIRDEGIEAVSLTGSQAGILTDTSHGHAKIREIKPSRVVEGLDLGKVVIVAGFQGVSPDTKGDHDPRPWRIGCHRRRDGGGPRRGRLRDLHRCRRGVHFRPADRARRQETR